MKKSLFGSMALAAVLSTGIPTPAQAGDPVAVGIGIKLLLGAAILSNRQNRGPQTSVNTQYALTGKGRPVKPNGEIAGAPHTGAVFILCDHHGHNCKKVKSAIHW